MPAGIFRIRSFLFSTLLSAALVSLLVSAPVSAQETGTITTRLSALKYVTVSAPDGKQTERLEPFTRIVPGDAIRYVVEYTNTSAAPVSELVVMLPLPREMTLVAGSGNREGTTVTFSVDGGSTFGALGELAVTDANGKTRAAEPSDVTHVRWTIHAALAAGATDSVGCRAVLK